VPFGPLIAAVVVSLLAAGWRGLRALLSQLIRWRVHIAWYLIAVAGPFLVCLIAAGLTVAIGAPAPDLQLYLNPVAVLVTLLTTIVLVGLFEEVGWRGSALPRLPAIWASWHLPVLVSDPTGQRPPLQFVLGILAQSVIFAWLYNSTNASLPIVIIFHAAANTAARFTLPGIVGGDYQLVWWAQTALYWLHWCGQGAGGSRDSAFMLPVQRWSAFLAERGIDLTTSTVTRLTGGEVNLNWKISAGGGQARVLRQYQVTHDSGEVDCELSAVAQLATSGFPTPPPLPGRDGRLWDWVDGEPAALFDFASGHHPPQRPGGYGSLDLHLGEQAARLAAQMHLTLTAHQLSGRREARRDPWHQLNGFLSGPKADHPLFATLLVPLQALKARLDPVYTEPTSAVSTGFIHNDITPSNLLLDSAGDVTALLDFDDSAQTHLVYELGAIIGAFGKDHDRRVDPQRANALVAAYNSVRALTPEEGTLLPDLLAAHAAAEGLSVLTNWLAAGRNVTDPLESFSIQEFLDIIDDRHDVRSALSSR
jgi:Ser/Thr protein kinase RdoA (MazF antagonist)/membrane protease YdiL (CAAX protease family)